MEGLHLRGRAGHQGDDQRGIDASGEEDAERHVRDHPELGRLGEDALELLGRFSLRGPALGQEAGLMPGYVLELGPVPTQQVTGLELGRSGVDRAGRVHVAVEQELPERLIAQAVVEAGKARHGLQLRSEGQAVRPLGPEERFLADAVAAEGEGLLVPVPHREGEHAAQAGQAGLTPLLPGLEDDLRVGLGTEGVAEALELGVVSAVAPMAELDQAVEAIVSDLLASAPLSLRMAKRAVDRGIETGIEQGLGIERECYNVTLFSDDRNEGLLAFAEKRPPKFQGR